MLVTLFGIVILVSLVQPLKADSPILVTLFGIVILVSPVQPENALSPIPVTLYIFPSFVIVVEISTTVVHGAQSLTLAVRLLSSNKYNNTSFVSA